MADNLQAVAEASARETTALRRLIIVALVVTIGTAFIAMWQVQEIGRVRAQVVRLQTALTAEADRRLQAMTPELEARAQRIEASADRTDRAVQGLDAKIDAAGERVADRAVQRMQQDMPGFLDQYFRSRLPR